MMTSLEQDDEKTPSKFKHLDDETLNKRFGLSRETYQKIEDEAFARLRAAGRRSSSKRGFETKRF